MPAYRWRPNRSLLRPWICLFIVGAVLAGRVTSAHDGRADIGGPPIPDTLDHEELIKRVTMLPPDKFLNRFVDCNAPPICFFRAQDAVACEIDELLNEEKISPEQVAKQVKDIKRVLKAFHEMYSKGMLKTLKLECMNTDEGGSVSRLLALYEQQPDNWLSDEKTYGDVCNDFSEIAKLELSSSREAFPVNRLEDSSSAVFSEKTQHIWFKLAMASLPSPKYGTLLPRKGYDLLFGSKWWTYSDLQLRTLSLKFKRIPARGYTMSKVADRLYVCSALLRNVYKSSLPVDDWVHLGNVIRGMFWDSDITDLEREKLRSQYPQLLETESAPDGRAKTIISDDPHIKCPDADNSANEELIKSVITTSTPENFVKYFIDCQTPPYWNRKARKFVQLLRDKTISPEQVAKHITDIGVLERLEAFHEMYRKFKLENLKWGEKEKFFDIGLLARLFSLYERQPEAWFDTTNIQDFFIISRSFRVNGVDTIAPSNDPVDDVVYVLRLSSLALSISKRVRRSLFQMALAMLQSESIRRLLVPPGFCKLLFDSEWWSYSDLQLQTLSRVFKRSNKQFRSDIFPALLQKLYCIDKLKLPNNNWGHLGCVIRKMFWYRDPFDISVSEEERKKQNDLLDEFSQLREVVYPIQTFRNPETEDRVFNDIIRSRDFPTNLADYEARELDNPEERAKDFLSQIRRILLVPNTETIIVECLDRFLVQSPMKPELLKFLLQEPVFSQHFQSQPSSWSPLHTLIVKMIVKLSGSCSESEIQTWFDKYKLVAPDLSQFLAKNNFAEIPSDLDLLVHVISHLKNFEDTDTLYSVLKHVVCCNWLEFVEDLRPVEVALKKLSERQRDDLRNHLRSKLDVAKRNWLKEKLRVRQTPELSKMIWQTFVPAV